MKNKKTYEGFDMYSKNMENFIKQKPLISKE